MKPAKCIFLKESVTFLLHTVSGEGIQTDQSKIRAIKNFPPPTTEKAVQQFMGLATTLGGILVVLLKSLVLSQTCLPQELERSRNKITIKNYRIDGRMNAN